MPGYIPKAKRSELSRDAGSSMLITAQTHVRRVTDSASYPSVDGWTKKGGVYTHNEPRKNEIIRFTGKLMKLQFHGKQNKLDSEQ